MGQFAGKTKINAVIYAVLLIVGHALRLTFSSPCQQMSFNRTQQLQELQQIIQEMSKEIMWVNSREEEELVFDWGDKNIDQYIPQKQESYSVSETHTHTTESSKVHRGAGE